MENVKWSVGPSASMYCTYIVEESVSLLFIDKVLTMNISNLCVGCNSNTLHISKALVGVMHVWSYSIIIKGCTIHTYPVEHILCAFNCRSCNTQPVPHCHGNVLYSI